jgi:hypothetical protein
VHTRLPGQVVTKRRGQPTKRERGLDLADQGVVVVEMIEVGGDRIWLI